MFVLPYNSGVDCDEKINILNGRYNINSKENYSQKIFSNIFYFEINLRQTKRAKLVLG